MYNNGNQILKDPLDLRRPLYRLPGGRYVRLACDTALMTPQRRRIAESDVLSLL